MVEGKQKKIYGFNAFETRFLLFVSYMKHYKHLIRTFFHHKIFFLLKKINKITSLAIFKQ